MNEERFWQIIDTAWASGSELKTFQDQVLATLESSDAKEAFEELDVDAPLLPDELTKNVRSQLDELSQDDLLAFDRILERKLYDIDREDVHEHTDGSDDGFLYCRGFIVAMGQRYYDAVNAEPSNAMFDWECEEINYISCFLYEEKFGEMPRSEISRETGTNPDGWS